MKQQLKIMLAFIITLVVFAKFQHVAFMERGYFAYGGEWVIWILPILYATKQPKKKVSKKMKKDIDK